MGRPAVVPFAGKGRGWMRAPVGALGGRWGAFFESAEGGAAGSEIGALPWGRWVRWGWTERTRSLPGGGRPRWAAKAGPGGGRRVGGRRPSG